MIQPRTLSGAELAIALWSHLKYTGGPAPNPKIDGRYEKLTLPGTLSSAGLALAV